MDESLGCVDLCACLNQFRVFVLGTVFMCESAGGLLTLCKSIFVYLSDCGGRLSVLSPCLQVMNTWLNGSHSDRVTNDVTLIDICTQGHAFPFLACCLNYGDMMPTPVKPSCCRSTAVSNFVSFKNDIY